MGYRWPDEIRDEVLARLLEFNAHVAEEERAGAAAGATGAERTKTDGPSDRDSRPATRASIAAERGPLWGTSDE